MLCCNGADKYCKNGSGLSQILFSITLFIFHPLSRALDVLSEDVRNHFSFRREDDRSLKKLGGGG